ncbi:MAG: bile acid:sodium symporter family protein [Notoacmeibacter sp.]
MDLLVNLILPLGLAVMMFSLGLSLTIADFTRVAQYPKAFAVGAFTQMVFLPISSLAVGLLFGLPPELALGLFILALCPGGPTSNYFTKLAHGDVALSVSLTAAITLTSVLTVPILAAFAGQILLKDSGGEISILPIALRSIVVIFVPIALGMLLRKLAPQRVAKVEGLVSTLAIVFVAAIVLGSLYNQWSNFTAWFPVLALSCFTLLAGMLLAGVVFGRVFGLQPAEITSISIDTAMQNAVMGISVGLMFAPSAEGVALVSVPSAIYGVMMYFVCLPFVLWRRSNAG